MTQPSGMRRGMQLVGALALVLTLVLASRPVQADTSGLITVSGVIYNDLNNNGVRDPSEPGLAGWTVFIDLGNTGQHAPGDPSSVSDANGQFSITASVIMGTYTVRAVPQSNWVQTAAPAPIVVPPLLYPSLEFGNHYAPLPAEVPESDTLWLFAAGGLAMILYMVYRRRARPSLEH